MEIRKSTLADIPEIMEIIAAAKRFMVSSGNTSQWINGYPGEDVIRADITGGNSYLMTEGGEPVGVFSFIIGEEPNYKLIRDGAWRCGRPYGTIHRLASNGRARGISDACFSYCARRMDYLRVDTHRDNLPMQAAITRFGFRACGIIYVQDGTERIAYDYIG